eukprot:TRINITY_DN68900_c0_g1_i1.p1 TRINITY_DN68900_c0_g1~~TRINITY_DN68900_c0_g1_i1.p1  ORF type:complete len:855 (+),score=145.88 TRINITY_DN68900_c0_g1_i1:157-2721(+)
MATTVAAASVSVAIVAITMASAAASPNARQQMEVAAQKSIRCFNFGSCALAFALVSAATLVGGIGVVVTSLAQRLAALEKTVNDLSELVSAQGARCEEALARQVDEFEARRQAASTHRESKGNLWASMLDIGQQMSSVTDNSNGVVGNHPQQRSGASNGGLLGKGFGGFPSARGIRQSERRHGSVPGRSAGNTPTVGQSPRRAAASATGPAFQQGSFGRSNEFGTGAARSGGIENKNALNARNMMAMGSTTGTKSRANVRRRIGKQLNRGGPPGPAPAARGLSSRSVDGSRREHDFVSRAPTVGTYSAFGGERDDIYGGVRRGDGATGGVKGVGGGQHGDVYADWWVRGGDHRDNGRSSSSGYSLIDEYRGVAATNDVLDMFGDMHGGTGGGEWGHVYGHADGGGARVSDSLFADSRGIYDRHLTDFGGGGGAGSRRRSGGRSFDDFYGTRFGADEYYDDRLGAARDDIGLSSPSMYGKYGADDWVYQGLDGHGNLDEDFDDPYDFDDFRYGSFAREMPMTEAKRLFRNRTMAVERLLLHGPLGPVMPAVPEGWHIPKVIHQTWKTEDLPSKYARHVASWRLMHPHWRSEFWDDHRGRDLVAANFPQYLADFDQMSGIKRADVMRIVALYVQGGIYADIDVEAVKPFDGLLAAAAKSKAAVLLGEENFVHAVLLERKSTWLVSNALMASAPGHPFWLEALAAIFSRTWCGNDPVECTGPRLLDRLSWSHLRKNQACGRIGCVVRLPFAYFSPNIAFWNAKNMIKNCQGQADSLPVSWRASQRRRKLERRACKALERTLAYPEALHNARRTHAVHHWQCSWCREDDSMRRTIPVHQVAWLVGNVTLGLVSHLMLP